VKTCSKCGQDRPVDLFAWRSKAKGTRSPWCKPCMRVHQNAKHTTDAGRRQRVADSRTTQVLANRQAELAYLLERPCVDCGETDPLVLQFDHVRDSKRDAVTPLVRRGCSWATVLEEIAKCEVRCANCHRRRTGGTFGYWKDVALSRVPGA
jgi:hypothetical protein